MTNTRDQQAKARKQRELAQAQAAAHTARSRRIQLLAGAVTTALVLVAIAVAFGGQAASGLGHGQKIAGVPETRALLAGVPQHGLALGDPAAPVTIVEFGDVQCPYCREHELDQQKTVINDLVRTGKARLVFMPHALGFMGEDSVAGQAIALRLSHRNQMWQFLNLFYFNQGEEQTGYVTPKFLRSLLAAIPGTSAADLARTADARDRPTIALDEHLTATLWGAGQFPGTPAFAIGKTGAPYSSYKGLAVDPSVSNSTLLARAVQDWKSS